MENLIMENMRNMMYLKTYELEKAVYASVCGWWAGCFLQVRWIHQLLPTSVITVLIRGNSSPLWAVVKFSMCLTFYWFLLRPPLYTTDNGPPANLPARY